MEATGKAGQTDRLIELNRPEKLNCLSLDMLDGLLRALRGGKADRIILTGAGRAFCTGLDLEEVRTAEGAKRHLRRLTAIYRWLLRTDCATVVLARGYAVGGGAGLMACAKTVIVSTDFAFRLPGGPLARLASVVPPVCNLRTGGRTPGGSAWLGCDLDATEALRLGLVDLVVSPGEWSAWVESVRNGTFCLPTTARSRTVPPNRDEGRAAPMGHA